MFSDHNKIKLEFSNRKIYGGEKNIKPAQCGSVVKRRPENQEVMVWDACGRQSFDVSLTLMFFPPSFPLPASLFFPPSISPSFPLSLKDQENPNLAHY